MAGIDLNKAHNCHVVDAVLGLAAKPEGFTVSELAQAVRERTRWTALEYSAGKASYDPAKLQGKKLAVKVPSTRRYRCQI